MTLAPQTTPTPAATNAATEPADGLGLDVQSSKQLAAAGVDVTDWKAKYDGLAGSAKQLTQKFNAQVAEREAQIESLTAQVADLSRQYKDLKTTADAMPDLRVQLETVKAEHAKAVIDSQKQGVLLKYPQLLATRDGKPNPLLDVLMATNLPVDQLEAKVAEIAGLDWGQATRSLDGAVPPHATPAGNTDSIDAARNKALAAHERFIASKRKDTAAEREEQEGWAEFSRLSKQRP